MNDKLKHFIASAIIAVLILLFFVLFVHREIYYWDAGIAAIFVVTAAASKEIVWDKWMKRGTPEFMDFFWGICGGWGMIFIWKIIEAI